MEQLPKLLLTLSTGLLLYHSFAKGEWESTLERCCSVGSAWGANQTTCTGPPLPIPGIQAQDRSVCLTAIYICCIKMHRHLHCEQGKQIAKSGQPCSLLPTLGGETHKDCCDACSLGLKARSRRLPCAFSNFRFDTPWREAYDECCNNHSPPPPATSPLAGRTRDLQHGNGTHYDDRCRRGYRLSANQQYCEDIDECELGTHTCNPSTETCVNNIGGFTCLEVPGKNVIGGRCAPGFVRKPGSPTCEDIDECVSGVCPPTHICTNTVGSYNCVPHRQSESCPPGFKQHPSTGRCIDVDECAEGIDGCNRQQEFCLNSHGGYQCQPKTTRPKGCPAGFKWSEASGTCEDVDECAERMNSCDGESQDCVNTIGSYQCNPKIPAGCPQGYRRDSSNDRCEDINECYEGTDDCDKNTQYCVNTIGSFHCTTLPREHRCGIGYRKDTVTGTCIDINECDDGTHTCNPAVETCVNTEGGYLCETAVVASSTTTTTKGPSTQAPVKKRLKPFSGRRRFRTGPTSKQCSPGYAFSRTTRSCVDIDECVEVNPCGFRQTCENTFGSYKCICEQGFTLDSVTKVCKDVNECQLGFHTCTPSQRCDNTIGSFICVRTTGCGTGYTLNADTQDCEDDDECALGTHDCGPDFACRNILGSFRCDRVKCPEGQKLLPDGTCQVVTCNPGMEPDVNGNCIDINECATSNICRRNQRCINTVGSYLCQNLMNCGVGYELNDFGTQCVDIDECARGTHECNAQQTCRNHPGSYSCECPIGYTMTADRQCEDVDECTRFRGQICSITSECENTIGSYNCHCREGFRKAEDGKNCIDIDECSDTPNICHQTCINVWGSYHCSCQQGYTLATDGRTCIDIDECSLYEGRGNLCIGVCVNEPGSYSCSCPEGYRLGNDKRTCQDIDECREQNVCKGDNEVCLNTRGSFKCNLIDCPPNYVRDREHRNRCKRPNVECRPGDSECLRDPLTYSYNYITFVSNMRIPPTGQLDLFTMRGPRFTFTSVQFELDLKNVRAPPGVPPATREHFHIRRTAPNESMVSLVKTLPGPQEVELDLSMKMYHHGLYGGTAVAKIFIFVTEHEY